jgi:hypothetical protein
MNWQFVSNLSIKTKQIIYGLYKLSYEKIGKILSFEDFFEYYNCSYLLGSINGKISGVIMYWVHDYGNKIGIVGASPTLYLRHTNSAYRSAMLHCNGNTFYILGAPYGGTPTQDNWGTVGSGRWPLTIDLTNNNAVFGGNVNCTSFNSTGYIYCDGTFQARGNCYFQHDLWHLNGQSNNRIYFGGGSTSYWSGNFAANFSPAHEWRLGYNQSTLGVLYNNGQMIMSSYGTFSDRRIKKDIEEINDDEALNILY